MLAEKTPQTFANHARFVPMFHFVTFGVLILNVAYRIYAVVRYYRPGAVIDLLLALALVLLATYIRAFDTRLQDRIVRLEMRLRLAELLPPDLRARIGELRVGQLIALRFAPDAELVELTREVLEGKLQRGRDIKARIRTWEPDTFRV